MIWGYPQGPKCRKSPSWWEMMLLVEGTWTPRCPSSIHGSSIYDQPPGVTTPVVTWASKAWWTLKGSWASRAAPSLGAFRPPRSAARKDAWKGTEKMTQLTWDFPEVNGFHHVSSKKPGWWFGTLFIYPYIGNNHPNWLVFFRGDKTTNQKHLADFTSLLWNGQPRTFFPALWKKRWWAIHHPFISD